MSRFPPRVITSRWLFPLAAVFAMLAIPLWLWRFEHGRGESLWHGHEMLFGYALLVVAGFLVTRVRWPWLAVLILTWLAGRLAFLLPQAAAPVAGMAFPVCVFSLVVPRLWRRAKRGENRVLPLAVTALVLLDAAWWWAGLAAGPRIQSRVLLGAVDVYALMLLVVGGRVVPATLGGYLERRGIARRDRRRREYELPLAGLMLMMLGADLAGLAPVAGAAAILVAAMSLVRVLAWQPVHAAARPELAALLLAYLWLLPALLLKGAAQLVDLMPVSRAIHGLTIGALGSLTLIMMMRLAVPRPRGSLPGLPLAMLLAGMLMSAAAILRLLAVPAQHGESMRMWAAAVCWALACLPALARLTGWLGGPGRASEPGRRRR